MDGRELKATILEALADRRDSAESRGLTEGRFDAAIEALKRTGDVFLPETLAVRCGNVTITSDGPQGYRADVSINGQSLREMAWRSFRLEGAIAGPILLHVEFVPHKGE